jgi:uncharacterized protein YggT (Ycf19 family)
LAAGSWVRNVGAGAGKEQEGLRVSYREEHTTHVVEDAPAREEHTTVTHRGSAFGTIERAIVYIFGLIQLVLVLRILLLLVAAREGNAIVSFIYSVSEIFVAPFRGILGIDEVAAGQAALDVSAIVALIGWTVIELLIIGLVRIARPRTA